jgi:enamine deaminase RidA (YjgF/YER057c/UK114 family)
MGKSHFVFMPSVPGIIEDEWWQCLDQINNTCNSGFLPLKLNIFVSQPEYSSYITVKKQIGRSVLDTFRDQCPSFNVTIHPPEKIWKIGVEGLFVQSGSAEVETKFRESVPYVVLKSGLYTEIWGAGLGNDLYHDDTRKAATAAFDSVISILAGEGMSLNNVVRQWNYIGEILKVENGFQNYQIFNEVRSEYYEKFRTTTGFPAATGIGMKYGGVFLDFCAVKADEDLRIVAVNNPNQVNAYEYKQQVLKGLADKGKNVKKPPQFERALLLVNRSNLSMFISGTASIIGQETIGKGDVREQTLVTIENINKLTNPEYVSRLLGNADILRGRYSLIRVYIKNQEDFAGVSTICSNHFPAVPAIYIESDICRDDLLMEIEAEYLF